MRLFVAVDLDESARQAAAAAAEELRRAIEPAVKARWVPIENMHLTVRFIGDVEDGLAPVVLGALMPPRDAISCVTAATVYRSYMSPKGSRYEALARVPLITP